MNMITEKIFYKNFLCNFFLGYNVLLWYNVINVEESRMIVYEVCFYFRGKEDGT